MPPISSLQDHQKGFTLDGVCKYKWYPYYDDLTKSEVISIPPSCGYSQTGQGYCELMPGDSLS